MRLNRETLSRSFLPVLFVGGAALSGCNLVSTNESNSLQNSKAISSPTFLPTASEANNSAAQLSTLAAQATQGGLSTRAALVTMASENSVLSNLETENAQLRETISAPESTSIDLQKRSESNAATTAALESESVIKPTESPEKEPIISQELTINDYRDGAKSESEVWKNVIGSLETDSIKEQTLLPSSAELPSNSNAMFTTLSNRPAMNGGDKIDFTQTFGTNPKTEPGLWHTEADFANYQDIAIDGNTKILDLIRKNEHDLQTGGFYAESNNRDVAAYFTASLIVASQNPEDFKGVTIDNLKKGDYPEKYVEEISQFEDKIFNQIQHEFLGESQAEKSRRLSGNDLSGEIPEENQKPDQFNSCDVNKEEDGMQTTRLVTQKDDPRNHNTFTEGNVGGAGTLIAFSEDAEGKWGVRAITNRAYTTTVYGAEEVYPKDAAGEQELNCAEEVAATETLAPTIIVTPTAVFTIPNSFTPFPTPTKEITVTPMLTNTPIVESTATPVIPNKPTTAPTLTPLNTFIPPTLIPATPVITEIPNTPLPTPTRPEATPTHVFVPSATQSVPTEIQPTPVIPNKPTTAPTLTRESSTAVPPTLIPATNVPKTEIPSTPLPTPTNAPIIPTSSF